MAYAETTPRFVYDRNRREIRRGDVLKVFHFVGARNKRYYMFKQALGEDPRHPGFMRIGHLDLTDDVYWEGMDNRILQGVEIVQGIEAFWQEDRPRKEQGGRDAD